MTQVAHQPEVFLEMRWSHRGWRAAGAIVGFGFFGIFALSVVIRAVLFQDNIWQDYNWVAALFVGAIGGFMALCAGVVAWRVIQNKQQVSRIDSAGITVMGKMWRWDQMRLLRPTRESGGGINIIIALKGRADRMFWVGRPLSAAEFEQLNTRLLPFLQSHYPDLLG